MGGFTRDLNYLDGTVIHLVGISLLSTSLDLDNSSTRRRGIPIDYPLSPTLIPSALQPTRHPSAETRSVALPETTKDNGALHQGSLSEGYRFVNSSTGLGVLIVGNDLAFARSQRSHHSVTSVRRLTLFDLTTSRPDR